MKHEQINERFADVLGERQRRMLSLILANPSLTYDALAKQIGVSSAMVRRDMSKHEDTGIVRCVGARKNGHWEVRGE